MYILLLLLLLGGIGYFVFTGYNQMRALAEGVKEGWSNISVVTRKKVSLINQLIDVVGNYQESEKFVMLQVSADSVASVQQAAARSGTVLAEIGRMANRFPELKSNQQYNRLMDSIQLCEADVQNTRLVYNAKAKTYNTVRTSLPNVLYSSALGFGTAEYLSLDAVEVDASVQRPMITDDSERVNRLLNAAGTKAISAARQIGQQGKALAEKGAARVQQASAAEQFHYVDSTGKPQGPVALADLNELFRSGAIKGDTSVMGMSSKSWSTYSAYSVPEGTQGTAPVAEASPATYAAAVPPPTPGASTQM